MQHLFVCIFCLKPVLLLLAQTHPDTTHEHAAAWLGCGDTCAVYDVIALWYGSSQSKILIEMEQIAYCIYNNPKGIILKVHSCAEDRNTLPVDSIF